MSDDNIVGFPDLPAEKVAETIQTLASHRESRIRWLDQVAEAQVNEGISIIEVTKVLQDGRFTTEPFWCKKGWPGWRCTIERVISGRLIILDAKLDKRGEIYIVAVLTAKVNLLEE